MEAIITAVSLFDKADKIVGKWQEITAGRGRHTLRSGTPRSGDVVLFEEQLRKGSKLFSTVSHTFSYDCRHGEEITAVVAYDLWSDDTGGDPDIVSGGVGSSRVSVRVTSQTNRGFHFKVIVYGKRQ